MAWDIADLSDFRVAAAPYGGPIGEHREVKNRELSNVDKVARPALIRDENKMILAGRHVSGKPKINIYTAAGQPIAILTVRGRRRAVAATNSRIEPLVIYSGTCLRQSSSAGLRTRTFWFWRKVAYIASMT